MAMKNIIVKSVSKQRYLENKFPPMTVYVKLLKGELKDINEIKLIKKL